MQENTLTLREFLQVHEPANSLCSACSAPVHGLALSWAGGRCRGSPPGACRSSCCRKTRKRRTRVVATVRTSREEPKTNPRQSVPYAYFEPGGGRALPSFAPDLC